MVSANRLSLSTVCLCAVVLCSAVSGRELLQDQKWNDIDCQLACTKCQISGKWNNTLPLLSSIVGGDSDCNTCAQCQSQNGGGPPQTPSGSSPPGQGPPNTPTPVLPPVVLPPGVVLPPVGPVVLPPGVVLPPVGPVVLPPVGPVVLPPTSPLVNVTIVIGNITVSLTGAINSTQLAAIVLALDTSLGINVTVISVLPLITPGRKLLQSGTPYIITYGVVVPPAVAATIDPSALAATVDQSVTSGSFTQFLASQGVTASVAPGVAVPPPLAPSSAPPTGSTTPTPTVPAPQSAPVPGPGASG